MNIIAAPLGWIMKLCYTLVKNYGIALLLFTVITRLIVFPLMIKQQKSSAKTSMINPELKKLQKKYGNNKEKLNEETMKLYSEAGINPMASCLPMLISMVILFAMIPVIYGPLTYVSNAKKDDVERSNAMITNLYTVSEDVKASDKSLEKLIKKCKEEEPDEDKLYKTLRKKLEKSSKNFEKLSEPQKDDVAEAFLKHNDIDKFMLNEDYFSQNLIKSRPELMTFSFTKKEGGKFADVLPDDVRKEADNINYDIFGLDMGKIPTFKDMSFLIPLISFGLQLISMFVSQHFMKKNNPESAQMMGSMNLVLFIMPVFSLWLTFKYPAGLGLYWCYSSLFALLQTIVLNKVYTPDHMAELVEKDLAKQKASGKKTFMEKMAEAQMAQSGKSPEEIKKALGRTDDTEKKKSKNQIKEEQRKKLNEARKRMAEKYGDDYTED